VNWSQGERPRVPASAKTVGDDEPCSKTLFAFCQRALIGLRILRNANKQGKLRSYRAQLLSVGSRSVQDRLAVAATKQAVPAELFDIASWHRYCFGNS
jgi:hypothetical protein